ncbi:hypothetical protein HAX54_007854 [Datura stramonium]|uniref:Uncharacterized protein n=1 Tax=Datura stramonium TaxID=4076 RepID=A0ABS8RVD3_DATST|nr:hypothetical protein [Datura stramonium]
MISLFVCYFHIPPYFAYLSTLHILAAPNLPCWSFGMLDFPFNPAFVTPAANKAMKKRKGEEILSEPSIDVILFGPLMDQGSTWYRTAGLRIPDEISFTPELVGIDNYLSLVISLIEQLRMDNISTECLLNNCAHVVAKVVNLHFELFLPENVLVSTTVERENKPSTKCGKLEEALVLIETNPL